MMRIADQAQRDAALDPRRSFIVQAPAGSGKTELLIQRFLVMLAGVGQPEEVLAITFTRKAAGEMRQRVIDALQGAERETPPQGDHHARTWQLARAVREADRKHGWQLAHYPARLRIMTLDALNMALTRQLPVLSRYGAAPVVSDEPGELYREAAQRCMDALEEGESWADAIAQFLLHHDGNMDLAAERLADMLRRRDQWLPRLIGEPARDLDRLAQAYGRDIRMQLERVRGLIPRDAGATLTGIAAAAADNLKESGTASPVLACAGLQELPGAAPEDLAPWRGLAELLLTHDKAPRWRATFRGHLGLPAGKSAAKDELKALIARLQQVNGLAEALNGLRALPPTPALEPAQEQLLLALLELLKLSVAHLRQVFAERSEVDYAEIALRALDALGHEDQPTDLALALDYRIQHILVDEFQDTSTTQAELLAALTRGWTPGDGHSLFVVGDPMQAIYRFREAEVGLFLRACESGLGDLPLEFLRLEVNFRSHQPLVAWVNQVFPHLLAPAPDVAGGGVPFSPATHYHGNGRAGFMVHPLIGREHDPEGEADKVVNLVRRRLSETDDGRIAILVRDRNHAAEILPALRRAGCSYRSVEMERLSTRPVVQDLTALTRALIHDGDRTAWLALLRAPWCGLTLADLLETAQGARGRHLPEALGDRRLRARLSADGRARLKRVAPVLEDARAQRGRNTLRQRVETTWHALGGAALSDAADLEDAAAFLDLLESQETAGDLEDARTLDRAMVNLCARPDPQGSERVQVMTMHGAKGLQFDTVILAGLHNKLHGAGTDVLLWSERPRAHGSPDLLLAPAKPVGREERDPHYRFVQALEQEKESYEQGRLLYVAATRAIRRLDLVASLKYRQVRGNEVEIRPRRDSLLRRLWPAIQGDCEAALAGWDGASDTQTATQIEAPVAAIRRVPAGWQVPAPRTPVAWGDGLTDVPVQNDALEYEWAGESARIIGVVIHRLLQQIAGEGLQAWNAERLAAQRPAIRALLAAHGLASDDLGVAEQRAVQALATTLASGTGRWLLDAHREGETELALGHWGPAGPETHVIDRCFLDQEGTRWLVDYKTGYRAGSDVEGFLAQEKIRHAGQLEKYRRLAEDFFGTPVRTALYFPVLDRFLEMD